MRYGKLVVSGLMIPVVLISLLLFPQPAWAGSPITAQQPYNQAQAPFGQPLRAALLSEGFEAEAFPPEGWGTTNVSGTDQGWSRQTSGFLPAASPHNGGGMARFYSWFLFSGRSTRLYSPVLDLSGQTAPALQFWMVHNLDYPAKNDRIQIQVSTDGGLTYPTTLDTISRYDGSTGWKQHTIDLSAYGSETNMRIGFLGISAFGNNIFIDDIHIGQPIILQNVYLPLVSVPVPIPPDGHWTGVTSRGHPMSFDVSGSGTIWSNFKLKTNFVIGSCSGTTEVNYPGPGAITGNHFSFSGDSFSFSGTLTSLSTATGTYSFTNRNIPDCGSLTQSGTWTAPPPPPALHWTGTTSRGQPMSFDVSSDGTLWHNFKLKTDFVIGSCSGTTEITIPGPGGITGSQFSVSSGSFSASGQLTSATTASGTYAYANQLITNCGYLTQSGTWTAQSP